MSDEQPIEVVMPGDKYARVMGMLLGNKCPIIGHAPGSGAFLLDGKVYHVHEHAIEVWDYSDFQEAVRTEEIGNYIHAK